MLAAPARDASRDPAALPFEIESAGFLETGAAERRGECERTTRFAERLEDRPAPITTTDRASFPFCVLWPSATREGVCGAPLYPTASGALTRVPLSAGFGPFEQIVRLRSQGSNHSIFSTNSTNTSSSSRDSDTHDRRVHGRSGSIDQQHMASTSARSYIPIPRSDPSSEESSSSSYTRQRSHEMEGMDINMIYSGGDSGGSNNLLSATCSGKSTLSILESCEYTSQVKCARVTSRSSATLFRRASRYFAASVNKRMVEKNCTNGLINLITTPRASPSCPACNRAASSRLLATAPPVGETSTPWCGSAVRGRPAHSLKGVRSAAG
eukprot:1196236-Prorocentrum_minimum.AAC.7